MTLRVLIDGLGLMGGSLAAALSASGAEVFCHHRRPEVALEAEARGWGQAVASPAAARQSGVINLAITCVPVSAVVDRVQALHAALPEAVMSDVGSTKGALCRQLAPLIASGHFVGSHPMCGSHAQGLAAAHAELYQGARVVITPLPQSPAPAVQQITELWQRCGARVLPMDPDEHDAAVAEASHLPHILAAQAARGLGAAGLPLAASGFRDTSRVAAAGAQLWADILLQNDVAVCAGLRRASEDLEHLAAALAAGERAAVIAWLEEARQRRERFDQRD